MHNSMTGKPQREIKQQQQYDMMPFIALYLVKAYIAIILQDSKSFVDHPAILNKLINRPPT